MPPADRRRVPVRASKRPACCERQRQIAELGGDGARRHRPAPGPAGPFAAGRLSEAGESPGTGRGRRGAGSRRSRRQVISMRPPPAGGSRRSSRARPRVVEHQQARQRTLPLGRDQLDLVAQRQSCRSRPGASVRRGRRRWRSRPAPPRDRRSRASRRRPGRYARSDRRIRAPAGSCRSRPCPAAAVSATPPSGKLLVQLVELRSLAAGEVRVAASGMFQMAGSAAGAGTGSSGMAARRASALGQPRRRPTAAGGACPRTASGSLAACHLRASDLCFRSV